MPNFQYKAGLQHVGSYQVSGRPFVSGGINADAMPTVNTAHEVKFPKVTRWVIISNNAATACEVGFSANGLEGTNYFTVQGESSSPRLELKLTSVFLTGSTDIDVIAGLTFIDELAINNSAISPDGSNWSGSAGI